MEKIKKVTFTFTGENRCPKTGEWFEEATLGSIALAAFDFGSRKNIYVREEIEENWKPKNGEEYFTILLGGLPKTQVYRWANDSIDSDLLNSGLVFRTRKSAEAKLKKIKEILLE